MPIELFIIAVSIISTLAITIVGYLAKEQSNMKKEMTQFRNDINNRVNSVESNYKSRFDDIKQYNNEQFTELKILLREIKTNQGFQATQLGKMEKKLEQS